MTPDELAEVLAAAADLPDGEGKVAELERIVAHADAAEDRRLGFDARIDLIEAYRNVPESWRVIPAFHWCLRTVDQAPELFGADDTEQLLFIYGWAVSAATNSSRVALADIDALLDDMERRFQQLGHSMRHVYTLRCFATNTTRTEQQARQWFERWRAAQPGPIGEPRGYDLNLQGALLADWRDDQAAIAVLEKILAEGLLRGEPELPLSQLMLPYLRQGRLEDAGRAHMRSYRALQGRAVRFLHINSHLEFCALSGHFERGLDILADHLPDLDQPHPEHTILWCCASAALLCRLATEAGLGERTIDRPAHGSRPAATVTVAALGETLAATAREIAARFDKRDGDDGTTVEINEHLAQPQLTEPFPLPGDGATVAGGAAGPGAAEDTDAARYDLLGPLTTEAIVAALDERGDHYRVEPDGAVLGVWDSAMVRLERAGQDGTVLRAQIRASRTLPADRLTEAQEFCHTWNRDTLLPKAFAYEADGTVLLLGEVTVDLSAGVSGAQLAVLISSAVDTGAQFAHAAEQLP